MAHKIRSAVAWLLNPVNFLFVLLGLVPLFLLSIFIFIHKENIAWADEFRDLNMVLAIRNGTFNIRYLFNNYSGHYTVFSFLATAILVVATDWNIVIGLLLNVALAASSCALVVLLFRRSQPEATIFMLPVFSMIIFSVHQDINWLGVYVGCTFFNSFFLLLGLWLLVRYSDRWPAIAAAAGCSLCATLSIGSGLLSWPLLGGILYFRGYRKWYYYLFWIASAAITLTVFLFGNTFAINLTRHLPGILDIVRFVFMYLGAVFVSRFYLGSYLSLYDVSLLVGLIGIILLCVNASYLWWKEKDRDTCTTWLPLAGFGIGAGILIAIARLHAGEPFGNRPFISWYSTMANLFWIAFAAFAAVVVYRISQTDLKGWWKRLLALSNISIGVALFALFVIQNQRIAATSYLNDQPDNWVAGTPITEECAVDYVFTLDGTCLAEFVETTNLMAAYRLNVFAHTSPISILPDEYQSGEPIIVETDSEWSGIHIRDWSLAGTDEDNIIFVFPGDSAETVDIPNPLDNIVRGFTAGDTEHLLEFLGGARTFWVVSQPDRYPSHLDTFFEGIEESGYAAVGEATHDPGGYLITEYQLASQ